MYMTEDEREYWRVQVTMCVDQYEKGFVSAEEAFHKMTDLLVKLLKDKEV